MQTHDERREAIRTRVEYWAQQLKVRPRLVRVQRMTRKWGSCSTSRVVTFAFDPLNHRTDFGAVQSIVGNRPVPLFKTYRGRFCIWWGDAVYDT